MATHSKCERSQSRCSLSNLLDACWFPEPICSLDWLRIGVPPNHIKKPDMCIKAVLLENVRGLYRVLDKLLEVLQENLPEWLANHRLVKWNNALATWITRQETVVGLGRSCHHCTQVPNCSVGGGRVALPQWFEHDWFKNFGNQWSGFIRGRTMELPSLAIVFGFWWLGLIWWRRLPGGISRHMHLLWQQLLKKTAKLTGTLEQPSFLNLSFMRFEIPPNPHLYGNLGKTYCCLKITGGCNRLFVADANASWSYLVCW